MKKASELKVGDPTKTETNIGPLSSNESLETISGIVEDAKEKGADILLGGSEIDGKGYFYSVGRLDLVCGIHSWNWIPYIDLYSCIYLVKYLLCFSNVIATTYWADTQFLCFGRFKFKF